MTTQTIISATVHGQASGNYDGSSLDWISVAVQAANYYRGQGSVQTVAFSVSGFEGTMTVEATLDTNPESAAWFDTYSYTAGSVAPVTDYYSTGIQGNFTWLRVRVENFSAGSITSVTATY